MKVSKIIIKNLFGITEQELDSRSVELIGENGTGKTSVIDAIKYGADIKSLEDVYFWSNPRKHQIRWKTVNGKRVKDVISAKAVDGNQLYKSLCTIRDRYNVDFVFCQKEETGQKIMEILGR